MVKAHGECLLSTYRRRPQGINYRLFITTYFLSLPVRHGWTGTPTTRTLFPPSSTRGGLPQELTSHLLGGGFFLELCCRLVSWLYLSFCTIYVDGSSPAWWKLWQQQQSNLPALKACDIVIVVNTCTLVHAFHGQDYLARTNSNKCNIASRL